MAIRAVLWDIDDTLFDYTSADLAGMRSQFAAEGLPAGYESAEQALARWRELMKLHWARFAAGECTFDEQRRARVEGFLGGPLSDREADDWFARHLVHFEAAWALFPDAVPVLDALGDGYRHAVLSNSSLAVQERKLKVLGVWDRFEAVLCAAELGLSKPAPGAFHAACDALGLPPEQVAYIGDEPDIDALGAVAAGLNGIWLDRTGRGGRPELVSVSGLDQVPDLLAGNTRFGAPGTFG
ncbi:hydrolase [Streptomyces spiroverticillatus]|uniref:Hydrolase n=1 Tax=Streptomyces finlayi TaxID=67296 RepID=A0A918X2M0_9ACTN|nr:HAD family hydrolase [Streptomyces finlayi]GHA24786.1 hydrolase [Streptomyces spiroverticillatus]GHD05728.1 hydrolase [Streptomyces finlayi]